VSGDGLPNEIINAIFKHKEFNEIKNIPLGYIPGGSGNGTSAALNSFSKENMDLNSALYLIGKNYRKKIDIIEFENEEQKLFGALSLTWAFVCECDFGSEFLRFLGGVRFELYAYYRVII